MVNKTKKAEDGLISIRKSGSFGVTNEAKETFFDGYDYVTIYVDKENRKIGFRPVEEDDDDTVNIIQSGNGLTINIPSDLQREMNLDYDTTTRFVPQLQNLNANIEIVVIDLDDAYGTFGE